MSIYNWFTSLFYRDDNVLGVAYEQVLSFGNKEASNLNAIEAMMIGLVTLVIVCLFTFRFYEYLRKYYKNK